MAGERKRFSTNVSYVLLTVFFYVCINNCKDKITDVQTTGHPFVPVKSENIGCITEQITLADSGSVLFDWKYSNDSLGILLRYTANCCSKFNDSLAINLPGSIALVLIDTTGQLCRCLCTHESSFRFFIPDLKWLRISCALKEKDQPYVSILDTVLVID